MEISSVNSDIIRGNVTTIILSSLWTSDRYGYDILKEIEFKSDGQYKLKQPTLYNQLKRLEKQGLISSYEGAPDDTGGGRRRYYSLTADGRNYLQKEKREYEYSRTILDKLVSSQEFDFSAMPAPFDTSELRPYTKRDDGDAKPKVVYKDKIVEIEKVVEVEKVVEKRVFLDSFGNEITEEEAKLLAQKAAEEQAEAEKLKREQTKPSHTLAEIFAKIDTRSEYGDGNETKIPLKTVDLNELSKHEPEEHTYFNAYNGDVETQNRAAVSLKDIFKTLEEREAQIDEQLAKEASADIVTVPDSDLTQKENAEFVDAQLPSSHRTPIAADTGDRGPFATSAVLGRRDDAFDYEKENVNYRDFFSSIASAPREKEERIQSEKKSAPLSGDGDLKTRLYAEGFKIRPYDRGNTSEYYTFNFLQSNRINRDCFLIVLAFFILETAVMWLSLADRVSYVYFLPILLCGAALCLIPLLTYIANPTKRTRANFNFKLSLLNRGMLFIELTVVCILIGFFALGASVNDTDLILQSIVLPMVLLTNLPLSSLIYLLLYRTKKYHIA